MLTMMRVRLTDNYTIFNQTMNQYLHMLELWDCLLHISIINTWVVLGTYTFLKTEHYILFFYENEKQNKKQQLVFK